ncbi:hypothetical protein Nepgr_000139 [Nepenthes gracilis]|uniref:non-specific serine/threonine protein kinase n=1 Tax=Nepenthes gracilis TaxID=150966 RepID=A0AAD3P415_NEPGR|nr:hypothetical protein Nepgr_000139 [Nepenthes gracilis]
MKNRTSAMQMKNSEGPYTDISNQLNKTKSILQQFKVVAKKIAGIFSIFIPKRKRETLSGVEAHGSGSRNASHASHASGSSFGFSTRSKSRSSSLVKLSDSFSSLNSTTGEVGLFNLSIEDIRRSTKDFSPEYIIGEGGFGTVYKGQLRDGSVVAIKRAKTKTDQYNNRLTAEFKSEIIALSKIEHLNLVRAYGYIEQRDERIIVVEYVSNGTLREHLDGTRGDGLELAVRLDIAIDVAHAITYLHTYTDPPIIHRDIKASNILLTDKLRAKVADFGFARLVPVDQSATHISTQIKGTAGYLDPEYLMTYQLTDKSDVYSFGVLLVELVTGRHPLEPNKGVKERLTTRWAMHKLKEGNPVIAMDLKLRRTPASVMAIEEMLKLSEQCLLSVRQSRPSMKKCAEKLWEIRKRFRDEQARVSCPSSAHHHSEGLLERDAGKNCKQSLGIGGRDERPFMSA